MQGESPLIQLVSRLTEQASDAIWRVLKNRYMPHPYTLGTLEIFRALESCRTGVAKPLLKQLASKGWNITNPKLDTSEYQPRIEPPPKEFTITEKGKRVLEKAIKYAKEQQELLAGTDHLLLALIAIPDSAFASMVELYRMDTGKARELLRKHLALDGGIKPALRAYDFCARIERDLKHAIIAGLKRKYGDNVWWVRGVPVSIRKKCAEIREEEGCVLDIEAYLYLISFKEIVTFNWKAFGQAMERATRSKKGKEAATDWIIKINPIRNAVMHPSKREISADDIEELQTAYNVTQAFCALIEEVVT